MELTATSIALIANGAPVESALVGTLAGFDWLIAVDGGLNQCERLGLVPNIAVGDFDSVNPELLERCVEENIEIRKFPTKKDQTDLELGLQVAVEKAGKSEFEIFAAGIDGGRIDHLLGNFGAIAKVQQQNRSATIRAVAGQALITAVAGERTLSAEPGSIVSLLPILGDANGVSVKGLEYPLENETLYAGSNRGVSNRFVAAHATVVVRSGTVLAVQPEAVVNGAIVGGLSAASLKKATSEYEAAVEAGRS